MMKNKYNEILRFAQNDRHAFTLAEVFLKHFAGKHKHAFTLAEVLITLGIIGVVAALTIPNLMANHRKKVVVERLKKASSSVMQAHNFATVEYGSDREGFEPLNPDAALDMFNKYYAPYMRFSKIEKGTQGVFGYLEDGSALYFIKTDYPDSWANTYIFVCITHKACQNIQEGTYGYLLAGLANGKDIFGLYTNGSIPSYTFQARTREQRIEACKNMQTEGCSPLIFEEGWAIPKDYPHRI